MAIAADGPVNEADLHARHRWLVLSDDAQAFRERMRTDPHYFDTVIAGWWCWGLCCWIGGDWCTHANGPGRRPVIAQTGTADGRGVHGKSKLRIDGDNPGSVGKGIHSGSKPSLRGDGGAAGSGVHASGGGLSQQIPQLEDGLGRGGHRAPSRVPGLREKIPHVHDSATGGKSIHAGIPMEGRPQLADQYDIGRGVNSHGELGTCAARRDWLLDWFSRLRDRLRNVRVCCGDWSRVCSSESVTTRLGTTGVFLDPPYSAEARRSNKLYAQESKTVAHDVRRWCLDHGPHPLMRICLAGYQGEGHEELEQHGWECLAWKAQGGYGNRSEKGKKNAGRERLWFSPHCVRADLFAGLEASHE